jgi:hypothetical protein
MHGEIIQIAIIINCMLLHATSQGERKFSLYNVVNLVNNLRKVGQKAWLADDAVSLSCRQAPIQSLWMGSKQRTSTVGRSEGIVAAEQCASSITNRLMREAWAMSLAVRITIAIQKLGRGIQQLQIGLWVTSLLQDV